MGSWCCSEKKRENAASHKVPADSLSSSGGKKNSEARRKKGKDADIHKAPTHAPPSFEEKESSRARGKKGGDTDSANPPPSFEEKESFRARRKKEEDIDGHEVPTDILSGCGEKESFEAQRKKGENADSYKVPPDLLQDSKGKESSGARRKKGEDTGGHKVSANPPSGSGANEHSDKYGLFCLNKLDFEAVTKAGKARYCVDIVAIHGLQGHAYDTWTHHRTDKLWLRDFLPKELPGARIFTFGYPAEVALTLAKGKLKDFARSLLQGLNRIRRTTDELSRNIIFVCHSMGGIVVKQALLTANLEFKIYPNIQNRVIGILFLATPHRGSSTTRLPHVLANVANVLNPTAGITGQIRTDLLRTLEKDSGELEIISTDFRNLASSFKIVSFIEQNATPPSKERVVDHTSGIMGIPDEIIVPMDGCDHREICKFGDPTSTAYQDVFYYLEKLAAEPVSSSEQPAPSRTTFFIVPFERDTKFIGREDIMNKIFKRFEVQRRVALAGIGGVGKSQIAIEFCYRFRDQHRESHIFWIHVNTVSRMDQAYKEIARKIGIPGISDPNVDTLQLVSDWLSDDAHGPWLLVLDNADDMDIFFDKNASSSSTGSEQTSLLVKHLPRSSNGSILITTRDKRVGRRLADEEKPIMVSPMDGPESEKLLWSKVDDEGSRDKAKSSELLELLGYLPLAITQAAAYISENSISVEEYLEVFHTNDSEIQDLLSEDLPDHRRESPSSVIRTWKVSFDQIRKQKPRAAEILSLMAMLDRQGIPKTLLRKDGEPGVEFTTAFGTLQAFSLVTAEKGGESFEIHRLVQVSTQKWLELHRETAKWQRESLKILAAAFPSGDYGTWAKCESLSPHAQVVARYSFACDQDLLQQAKLLHNMSWYAQEQGRYNLAYERGMEALSIQERVLGQKHENTLSSIQSIGIILSKQGKTEAAEEMKRRGRKLYEQVLDPEDPEDPHTLITMINRASELTTKGKYEEAEEMHRRVLEIYERVFGLEHPDTLISANNFASGLMSQGKYKEAEEMYRRTLGLSERVLGLDDPNTLIRMSDLASVLVEQGKHEEAEKMHRQTLNLRERVLGPEHPNTLSSMHNLAGVLWDQGKYEEAEEVRRRVPR
ncbi:hypothetical protein EG329_000232 [Mollisiaceae sp. DMI_Dod_QoI]|nr:hypothetical protein EG329_000232 [Helotiales sp. DMI_Dod_QoI]